MVLFRYFAFFYHKSLLWLPPSTHVIHTDSFKQSWDFTKQKIYTGLYDCKIRFLRYFFSDFFIIIIFYNGDIRCWG